MRRIDRDERRARLAHRHHLAIPASDVETAAAAVVGLHASDPASVYLAARVRVSGLVPSVLEQSLYDDRSLLRVLGMRRTMFVVPPDLARTMHSACSLSYVPAQRRRMIRLVEDQGIAEDGSAWLEGVETETMAALRARGEATATELGEDVPDLRLKFTFGEGTRWAGTVGISTRVLFLLAGSGRIIRGRPLGTWLSSQYRWVPAEAWVTGGFPEGDRAESRAALADAWLRAYGPGTQDDLKWWSGWGVRDTRNALVAVDAEEVELEGSTGYIAAGDHEDPPPPPPARIALLPALDPTVMGWRERDWYLGAHREKLFDRNGNAGPTVWHEGRVIGGWTQRPDGAVVFEFLEPVDSETSNRVEEEAARLESWLGQVRVVPRFRTPLEKTLAAR